jgi:hypothetical protein
MMRSVYEAKRRSNAAYTGATDVMRKDRKETEQAHDANENYRPKDGYVDNPKMAAEIAELVAKRVYGKSHIEAQRPYIVTRNGDKWIVRGSFSEKPDMKGGVFEVRLSSSDGRVARLIHGK